MPKFIVLEGLSGSGKTTIARLLSEKMSAVFYKTPPILFSTIREEIDRIADDLSHFFFYLSGIVLASQELVAILKERDVVCDRYVYTTICYHRAIGLDIQFSDNLLRQIVMPDHFFLITCHEETRVRRLVARGMSINDVNERKAGVEERFLAEYRKYKPIEIDNSSNDPNQAVEQILAHYQRRLTT